MPATPANSEWLTRKKFIDQKLRACGWRVVPFKAGQPLMAYDACAAEEFETDADYTLCLGGQVVGVVEAKKLALGPQNVLLQAERYSKGISQTGLSFGEYGVPFLYSTNGEVIWFHDIRHDLNRSRQVSRFHTVGAVADALQRNLDESLAALQAIPNNHPWGTEAAVA